MSNHYLRLMSRRKCPDVDIVFEDIGDEKTKWKYGDIIKFYAAYCIDIDTWKQWFLSNYDIKKEMQKPHNRRRINKNIPYYAHRQYGIIISRYRKTKKTHYSIFRDYGSVIMMISGSNIGTIKHIYCCAPFNLISSFPYDNIPKRPHKILSKLNMIDFASDLNSRYGNCYETRSIFVKEFQKRINEECL